ncbi:hypothetical protein ACOZ4L_01230 [Haloplanus ruber]|uniref:HAMP domain-containing protein n=1 Tax=Haloplanus ruber TaxID=869892 RepID=A0ABD6CYP1_9EURY|nr:hypothetical protein [Haloplanus ruber]
MDEGVTGVSGRGDDAATHPTNAASEAERYCYDGESVVTATPLGTGWAAVTSHRVVAYNPAADGRRFEAVDRPNVAGMSVDAAGDRRLLGWGIRALGYGLAAAAGGAILRAMDLGATLSIGSGAAGTAPVGGVLTVIDVLASALATLTTLLLFGGLALSFVGLALLARYLRTRRSALVIERFGDEPVRLSVPQSDGERAVRALSGSLDEPST